MDLDHALTEFLPATLWLDDKKTRSLFMEKLDGVVIEPRGVRLTAGATLRWELPGMAPQFKLERLELWIRPRISKDPGDAGKDSMVFELEVGTAAFTGLPSVLRGGVVTAVNLALDRLNLRWKHGQTLANHLDLPPIFEDALTFHTASKGSSLRIDPQGIHFGFELEVGFTR